MTRARPAGTPVPPLSPLPSTGFLAALPDGARDALLARGVERRFPADAVLFQAGTEAGALWLLLEGRVRVVRVTDGRVHVVHEEGPGGTLGDVPLFEGRAYPATAIAMEPVRCIAVPRDAVHAALRAQPALALALLARLAGRVRQLVERVDSRTSHDVRQRLAALLLSRHAAAGGRMFVLGRSQQAAAEELGTVREVVVRALRALRAAGVVRAMGGGRYVVTDEPALRRAAAQP